MKTILQFCFIGLLALSCTNIADHPAPDTCKLSSSTSVKSLTYDINGRVATLTTEIFNGTTTALVLSTFSYDVAGRLAKTVYTADGNPISAETYTYTNGRITQVSFSGPSSPTGINNLSYDAAGRLARYTVEVGGQLQYAQVYTYAADGILTEQSVVGPQGEVLFRTVVKPVGSVKSPENLLVKKGLPYLIPTGAPLPSAEGGVGSVVETYAIDNTGNLVLVDRKNVSAVKTNTAGYLTKYTLTDATGSNPVTLTYTLTDCP